MKVQKYNNYNSLLLDCMFVQSDYHNKEFNEDLERVSSTLADNSLSNVPNSLDHTQPHLRLLNL